MKRRGRRAAVLLVTGVIALAASMAGYAYWTSTGTSSGSASVGTTTPWEVTVAAASGPALSPGGAAQSFDYTVTNTGSVDQRLTSVSVSVATSGGSAWTSGSCSAADFSVNGAAAGTPYVDTQLADLYGPSGYETGTVQVSMVATNTNQNDCKGVTVPLYFAAS